MCCLAAAATAHGAERGRGDRSASEAAQSTSTVAKAKAPAKSSRARKAARRSPKIESRVPRPVYQRLVVGYTTAMQRVRSLESCNGLFAQLGADGAEVLSTTVYSGPQTDFESEVCGRSTAFTAVGRPDTRLCPGFGDLKSDDAAVVLIHEALHHAGLEEAPGHEGALTAVEIDEIVVKHCGL
jgi:hypothetical protein